MNRTNVPGGKMLADLPVNEIVWFRALGHAAVAWLLLLRLERPANASELAEMLGVERRTAGAYLRRLERLGLVRREPDSYAYLACKLNLGGEAIGLQDWVDDAPGVEENPPPAVNDDDIKNPAFQKESQTSSAAPQKSPKFPRNGRRSTRKRPKRSRRGKNMDPDSVGNIPLDLDAPDAQDGAPPDPELIQVLRAARIHEPKRGQLARLPDLTPGAVRLWEAQLKQQRGDQYQVGLLIHILESGEPPPEANANGHLEGCDCPSCKYLGWEAFINH
jgi:DNA-binding transcriptional ArsR family regulator